MPRIRTIKPEFFRSRSLSKVSIAAERTFAGLWTEADDAGNGIADADVLKGALWSKRPEITARDVEEHLLSLHQTGHIRLYTCPEGEPYYHIVKWEKHQSPAMRRGPARYPLPPPLELTLFGDEISPASREISPAGRDQGSLIKEGNGEQNLALVSANGRQRDLVWEAMVEVCGLDPTEFTKTARGAANAACAELKLVGATPQAILERAVAFRRIYPRSSLTPNALVKHWGQCGARADPPSVYDRAMTDLGLQPESTFSIVDTTATRRLDDHG